MKSKDKKVKITLRNIITFLTFIISLLYLVIFYNFYFVKNDVYASEETSATIPSKETKISNAAEINLDEIIQQNTKQGQREEFSVEEKILEYITTYRNNSQIPKGEMQVKQEGREGKQEVTIKKTYQGEELISEEQISNKITKATVNKIVEIGTGQYASNHKVKVGDNLFVTSDRLSVRYEPQEDSQKVATLTEGTQIKVVEIKNDWYKISSSNSIGYVKAEGTTYIDKNASNKETTSSVTQKSKSQLTSGLSFDMPLNKPSGLTIDQFKKILSDSKDKNNIFEQNAEYFYYIEQQYNINGVFVAAVGIHESAWGTSKISRDKNNLFGYGAYDSNPYGGAYSFSNYSESIDLIARVFVKYYLNPKGTSIYGGEKAVATYYYGSTLSAVNTKYATDKNWANSVYQHMKYLYNKL